MQQLLVNREDFKDTDIAEIEVRVDLIELRAVGTESAVASTGRRQGVARMPILVLSKLGDVAGQFKLKTITILVEDGRAKIGHDGCEPSSDHPELKAVQAHLCSGQRHCSGHSGHKRSLGRTKDFRFWFEGARG